MRLGWFVSDCENGSGGRALYTCLALTKLLYYCIGGRKGRSVSSQSVKRFSTLSVVPGMRFATAQGCMSYIYFKLL